MLHDSMKTWKEKAAEVYITARTGRRQIRLPDSPILRRWCEHLASSVGTEPRGHAMCHVLQRQEVYRAAKPHRMDNLQKRELLQHHANGQYIFNVRFNASKIIGRCEEQAGFLFTMASQHTQDLTNSQESKSHAGEESPLKFSLPARYKSRTPSGTPQEQVSIESWRQSVALSSDTESLPSRDMETPRPGQYRKSFVQNITTQGNRKHPFDSIPLSKVADIVLEDEIPAAKSFTQAASQGHPWANLIMGKAYEHAMLSCPKDSALSIHFYNQAAEAGLPEAMMALCAWYVFGAEGVLDQDEDEAFAWAKRAADRGHAPAEYTCGYFKEVGLGCNQDAVQAVEWYLLAAAKGEQRARKRLEVIQEATSGETTVEALRDAVEASRAEHGSAGS